MNSQMYEIGIIKENNEQITIGMTNQSQISLSICISLLNKCDYF